MFGAIIPDMAKPKSAALKAPIPPQKQDVAPPAAKADVVLVRIDPASQKLSFSKLGLGVFQADNVYKMSAARAALLRDIYVKTGDPSSGRLFLLHTCDEAKAWEALQREKIREPRGTTDDPIEFNEDARAVA